MQRSSSSRQIVIVCWFSLASSLIPQRRSMAWNRAPCFSQDCRTFGEDAVLQDVTFHLQIAKRRADENTKRRPGVGHRAVLDYYFRASSNSTTCGGFMHGQSLHGVLPFTPSLPTSAKGPGPALKTTPLPSVSQ